MSYRKFPPDLDGLGIFIAVLVIVLFVIVVIRIV